MWCTRLCDSEDAKEERPCQVFSWVCKTHKKRERMENRKVILETLHLTLYIYIFLCASSFVGNARICWGLFVRKHQTYQRHWVFSDQEEYKQIFQHHWVVSIFWTWYSFLDLGQKPGMSAVQKLRRNSHLRWMMMSLKKVLGVSN